MALCACGDGEPGATGSDGGGGGIPPTDPALDEALAACRRNFGNQDAIAEALGCPYTDGPIADVACIPNNVGMLLQDGSKKACYAEDAAFHDCLADTMSLEDCHCSDADNEAPYLSCPGGGPGAGALCQDEFLARDACSRQVAPPENPNPGSEALIAACEELTRDALALNEELGCEDPTPPDPATCALYSSSACEAEQLAWLTCVNAAHPETVENCTCWPGSEGGYSCEYSEPSPCQAELDASVACGDA